MPMNENEFLDTLFEVGINTTFTAGATGELVCFANDALGLYWNNQVRRRGAAVVTAGRGSPTSSLDPSSFSPLRARSTSLSR